MIDEKVEFRVKNIVKQYVDPLINELKSMIKPGSTKNITKLEVSVKKQPVKAKRPLSTASSKKTLR